MGYHHSLSPHAAALQLAIVVGAILAVVFVAALARALLYSESAAFGVALVSGAAFGVALLSGVSLLSYLVGLAIGAVIIDPSEGEEP